MKVRVIKFSKVSSTQAVADWIIISKSTTVTNNAKLTFRTGESVTINTPFTVNAGSRIEIPAN